MGIIRWFSFDVTIYSPNMQNFIFVAFQNVFDWTLINLLKFIKNCCMENFDLDEWILRLIKQRRCNFGSGQEIIVHSFQRSKINDYQQKKERKKERKKKERKKERKKSCQKKVHIKVLCLFLFLFLNFCFQ